MDIPAGALLSVAYLPDGSFVLPILGSLQRSEDPKHRAAAATWVESGLGLLAVSLSTKMTMLSHLVPRVNRAATALSRGLPHGQELLEYRRRDAAWTPESRDAAYLVLLEIDAFIFEFRSAYEILGKFIRRFCELVLSRQITEQEIQARVESQDVNMSWVRVLQEHRKLFFHQQAPWIAFRYTAEGGERPELVVLPHAGPAAEQDPALTLEDFRLIVVGFVSSVNHIQQWLLEELRISGPKKATP